MQRNKSLDSLKFLFSIAIVYYHILHSNMERVIGTTGAYQTLSEACGSGHLIVECFLIIAGFFLYSTYRKGISNIPDFAVSRLVRLWPAFIFQIAIILILSGYKFEALILDVCLLRCTGISLAHQGICWYIPPFFWCSVFLFSILQILRKESALLLIAVLTYLAYCVNLNSTNGDLGRHVVFSWCSLGVLRVLGGLGAGLLIAAGIEYFQGSDKPEKVSRTRYIWYSIAELVCIALLTCQFLVYRIFTNAATTVVIFSYLLIIIVKGGGVVSKLLGRDSIAGMGKYCYCIYVMQQAAFVIMRKTTWKWNKELWMNLPVLSIIVTTIFSIALGVFAYHLVERPCSNWYKRRKTAKSNESKSEHAH